MENKTAILVLNGPDFNSAEFKKIYKKDKYLTAVDGGVKHLKDSDVKIDILVGDMDSCGKGIPGNVASTWSFDPEKDESDFDLALDHIDLLGIREIEVFAATGGRYDHFLSNYETAVKYAQKGMNITFYGVKENLFFLNSSRYQNFAKNSTISIFAGTEKVKELTLKGFKYEVEDVILERSFPLGLSNKIVEDEQKISFTKGIIVVIENF